MRWGGLEMGGGVVRGWGGVEGGGVRMGRRLVRYNTVLYILVGPR